MGGELLASKISSKSSWGRLDMIYQAPSPEPILPVCSLRGEEVVLILEQRIQVPGHGVAPFQPPFSPAPFFATSAPGGAKGGIFQGNTERSEFSALESCGSERARDPCVVTPLAFAQARRGYRPLLTSSSLLPQSPPWDRIHDCHQGAGPPLADDDPEGAETILVRSPCPEGVGGGGEAPASHPALIFRALSSVMLETGWEFPRAGDLGVTSSYERVGVTSRAALYPCL